MGYGNNSDLSPCKNCVLKLHQPFVMNEREKSYFELLTMMEFGDNNCNFWEIFVLSLPSL